MSATAFDKQKNLREELAKTFKPKYREVPTQKWFSQLVNNGANLTTTAGWAGVSSTLSAVSNRLRITNTATYGSAHQVVPAIIGNVYHVYAEYTPGSSTGWYLRVGTSTTSGGTAAYNMYNSGLLPTNASHTGTFTATSSDLYVNIQLNTVTASQYTDFNNISVREAYVLPSNILVTKVFDNGALLKPNTDYTIVDDGLTKTISFTVEPNVLSDVLVEYWEQI